MPNAASIVAGQPRHHCSHRHAGDFGDFVVGKFVHLAQHDGLAERRWQFGDELANSRVVLRSQQHGFGRGLRLLPHRHLFRRGLVLGIVHRNLLFAAPHEFGVADVPQYRQ
jgi:hypothetical protein